MDRVDDAMWPTEQPGIIFATFGDMMRVPGSKGNLIEAKARGADVRFVYSPLDALKVALDNPDRHVVFFAVGFETTAPSTAVTLIRVCAQPRCAQLQCLLQICHNRSADQGHLESPDLLLDGFLGPGHVSTVVGVRPYRIVPEVYGKPVMVAGFESLDILASVHMLLQQIRDGRREVENPYTRAVPPEGQHAGVEAYGRDVRVAVALQMARAGFHFTKRRNRSRINPEEKAAAPPIVKAMGITGELTKLSPARQAEIAAHLRGVEID